MKIEEFIGNAETIWSLMYSPHRVNSISLEEQIIEINTEELRFSADGSLFTYIWGWPGPDYNVYSLSTYGRGWALTKEEILQAWENKNENTTGKYKL